MTYRRPACFSLATVLGLALAAPVAAREYGPESGRAIHVHAQAGAFRPLASLDDAGDVGFSTGPILAVGGAYQRNHIAFRANIGFARAKVHDDGSGVRRLDHTNFNRFLYDADVQLRRPLRGGVTPYAFIGGGAVTVQREVSGTNTWFTKRAGKGGIGAAYHLPRSRAALHAETAAWVYRWDRFGFDRRQVDVTLSAGLSYRFRLR